MSARRKSRKTRAISAPQQPDRERADIGPAASRHRREVVFVADPDNPDRTIKRARVSCHYDVAWRRGKLTDRQRLAAEAYAELVERAEGARTGADGAGVRVAPHQRGSPSEAQVAAVAQLRSAHHALGAQARAVVRLYVVQNLPAERLGVAMGEDERRAMGRIVAALDRLAEHWGM